MILKKHPYLIAAFFILLLISNIQAQKSRPLNLIQYDHNPYNFGFTLGLNQMLFTINHMPLYINRTYSGKEIDDVESNDFNYEKSKDAKLLIVESNSNFGFTIGIVSNLRLGQYFDLRFIPSLSFGERDLSYSINLSYSAVEKDDNGKIVREYDTVAVVSMRKPLQSTFVEFPFYIKYKSKRMNNTRAYLIGGAKYSLDLISDARRKEKAGGAEIVKLHRNDLYLDLGAGFDFYNEYFKLGVEIKMSYGLNNLIKKEGTIYTEGIDRLRSKIFTLSLTFE